MATDFVTPVNSSGAYQQGTPLPLGDLAQTFSYTGNFLTSITVSYYGNSYVQTFTNNGTHITSISGWVLQ